MQLLQDLLGISAVTQKMVNRWTGLILKVKESRIARPQVGAFENWQCVQKEIAAGSIHGLVQPCLAVTGLATTFEIQ
jgi:nicotinate-nucleotide pyrophosphorylase